jgi:hypothetical protein
MGELVIFFHKVVCILSVLGLTASGCQPSGISLGSKGARSKVSNESITEETKMMELPNTEQTNLSPPIPESAFGIWLSKDHLKTGGDRKPQVVFSGSYRVTSEIERKYRRSILDGILIFAVDSRTLQVYKGVFNADEIPVEIPGSKPLVHREESESALVAVEGYFNFDLIRLCSLPATPGQYFVFAMLDFYKTESVITDIN